MLSLLSRTTLILLLVAGLGSQSSAQSSTQFIPPEAAVAILCNPPHLRSHEALNDVPWDKLSMICQSATGIYLENVNSLLIFAASPGSDGIPMIGAVVELRDAIPLKTLVPQLQMLGALKFDESRGILVGPAIGSTTWEVRPIDETTLLIGLTPTVAAMQKQKENPVAGELTAHLSQQSDAALEACLMMQPLRRLVSPLLSDPRLNNLVPGIDQVPDQLASATLQLDLSDVNPQMTLNLEAVNPIAAEQLYAFASNTWQQGLESLGVSPDSTHGQLVESFRKLEPTQEGSNVTLTTKGSDMVTSDMYVRGLTELVMLGTEEASFQTRRLAAIQDLKRITFALHSSSHQKEKRFFSNVTPRPDGKQLLSWRVQLLPYLDQQELYDQFHLDEPWDSPHNLTLVKQMPEAFTIPGDEDLAAEGKTRYQLPIGEGMPGGNLESIYFSDITDGTSNTIFAVEAARDHAVIWTQPADLPVDLANPKAALLPGDSPGFSRSLYDGSAGFFDRNVSDKLLKVMLTHQGGDVPPRE